MKIKYSTLIMLLLTALISSYSNNINAAFCSLRDPLLAINQLYNENYKYRSLVTPISSEIRKEVQNELPFTLHHSEIGTHTLYLVLENTTAKGFVHARSELTNWGIIELAWGISLDMKINGVYFQRCRSPMCTKDLAVKFSKFLKGKSSNELLSMITPSGNELAIELTASEEEKELLLLSIRSALKTLSVTQIAWSIELENLKTFPPPNTIESNINN